MPRRHPCQSFPPSSSPDAEVLILGSMPGQASLQAQQYYAHPHNAFWGIMGELFGAGRELAYAARLKRLARHRVALWDVAFRCERRGSLDAKIRLASVVPNDFRAFLGRHRRIHTILFNGQKAEQLFRALVAKRMPEAVRSIRCVRLPSTSPAHASLSRGQKLARWRAAMIGAGLTTDGVTGARRG